MLSNVLTPTMVTLTFCLPKVQDALVRDVGGAVADNGECRTLGGERFIALLKAVAVVALAAFVWWCSRRLGIF